MSGSELRIPPSNREAERAVLGSMLRDNDVIPAVLQIVQAESFYTDADQKICRATKAIADRGQPVDTVLLADYLKEQNQVDDIGYGYLGELLEAAPTAANAEYYAGIVSDKAQARELIHVCTEIVRDAFEQSQPASELREKAEMRIMAVGDRASRSSIVSMDEAVRRGWDRIDERAKRAKEGKSEGITTGLIDLDEKTGGFRPSELTILGARTSQGKTAFAMNVANRVAVDGQIPTLFVSLEQPEEDITDRLLCLRARVQFKDFRDSKIEDPSAVERIYRAGQELARGKLFIDRAPRQTAYQVAASARRLHRREGVRLLIVDYLQFIEPESDRRETRQEAVAGISRKLKQIARELRISVLCLAQLNREVESRQDHEPKLSDLRDSGAIEQDADAVWLLYRPEAYSAADRPNEADLIIAKQRNGPLGRVRLIFRGPWMGFENYAPDIPAFAYESNGVAH